MEIVDVAIFICTGSIGFDSHYKKETTMVNTTWLKQCMTLSQTVIKRTFAWIKKHSMNYISLLSRFYKKKTLIGEGAFQQEQDQRLPWGTYIKACSQVLIGFGGSKGISMGIDVCLYYIFNTNFAWAQQTLGKGRNNLGALSLLLQAWVCLSHACLSAKLMYKVFDICATKKFGCFSGVQENPFVWIM